MALIQCPECGKEISDRAGNCPNCGYPIEALSPEGIVKIKVSALQSSSGLNGNQKVTILSGDNILWEGKSGEVAEMFLDGERSVTIKYHTSFMHYGGECFGTLDPAKSKKYNVSARQGVFATKLVLQPVDYFDAD